MPVILPYKQLIFCTLYARYPALQTHDVLYTVMSVILPYKQLMYCKLYASNPALQTHDVL